MKISTLPSNAPALGGYNYSCKFSSVSRSPCQWQWLPSPLIAQKFKWPQMNSKFIIKCVRRGVRKAKRRYPSERRELKQKIKQKEAEFNVDSKNREDGYWRFFKVPVPVEKDPGKDYVGISDALMEGIARYIKFPVANILPQEAFSVVRKSFDARKCLKEPKFVYTVDMNVKEALSLQPQLWDFISDLSFKAGKFEYISSLGSSLDLISLLHDGKCTQNRIEPHSPNGMCEESTNQMLNMKDIKQSNRSMTASKPKVVVVGSGPAGLFASLVLAELGAKVTIVERGQPVEKRGRDIGALVVRRQLKSESNFCFGEGGAGTWSDGKLTTKIGKNSDNVQTVLKTLVHFGAPADILIDGKPHLGTDRLIRILLNFRKHLQDLGVQIMFGTRMDDLLVRTEYVIGVQVSDAGGNNHTNVQKLESDAVILAVGHSARDVYKRLLERNVLLIPKDFAVGFRVEHPQDLINKIQYSKFADEVHKGRGKVPVADYKLATYLNEEDAHLPLRGDSDSRACYSFCMCPGGQVVLTSTNPSELCINGMSFSNRSSRWANAAIVLTVSSKDFGDFQSHGHLAGVAFQREYEKEAAIMGGGNFVVPVQTVPDFLENKLSGVSLPPSSYRLGVKAAPLHQLFPSHITHALKQSLIMFEKEIPGFISKDALLHAVETRTSAPVKIPRDMTTYESLSAHGLYPIGEGAGYAGGIVSAAVDGLSNPASYMVEEIWQELAKARYLFWESASSIRLKKQRELRVICERALWREHERTVIQSGQSNIPPTLNAGCPTWSRKSTNDGDKESIDLEGESISCQNSSSSENVYKEQCEILSDVFNKAAEADIPTEVPEYLCCKITLDIFRDPVITPSGVTYERAVILEHIQKVGKFDPITREPLQASNLVPNFVIKEAVQAYLDKHGWAYKTTLN